VALRPHEISTQRREKMLLIVILKNYSKNTNP
jgi:hypothetical protein